MPSATVYRMSVNIDPDLGARLDEAIAATRDTKREFIERAIRHELERLKEERGQ